MAAKSIAPFLVHFKNVTKLHSNVNTIQIRNKWWSNTPIKTNTNYKVVMPGNVSKQIAYDMIPNHIILPPYAKSGIPPQITEKVSTRKIISLITIVALFVVKSRSKTESDFHFSGKKIVHWGIQKSNQMNI